MIILDSMIPVGTQLDEAVSRPGSAPNNCSCRSHSAAS